MPERFRWEENDGVVDSFPRRNGGEARAMLWLVFEARA
jgi:hypothetical protein